ncbi:hypothetical protein KXR64_21800 [Brucella intermedia]|uniref:hypothetical protein n=1 Tax=Brucella TaxID=234 RepID=UPI000A825FD7|nr:hypothetical protein [Brucella intermedia]
MTSISTGFTTYSVNSFKTVETGRTATVTSATTTNVGKSAGAKASGNDFSKPFSEVALDARSVLDAGYKELSNDTADTAHATGAKRDLYSILDTLDRRSLYAIASNHGGLFSDDEVLKAKCTLGERVQEALDPFFDDRTKAGDVAFCLAYIKYLDEAGPEERASLKWAHARAVAELGYERNMRDQGIVGDNVDSGNPVVALIRQAHAEWTDPSRRLDEMPSWLKALDLCRYLNDDPDKRFSWKV